MCNIVVERSSAARSQHSESSLKYAVNSLPVRSEALTQLISTLSSTSDSPRRRFNNCRLLYIILDNILVFLECSSFIETEASFYFSHRHVKALFSNTNCFIKGIVSGRNEARGL